MQRSDRRKRHTRSCIGFAQCSRRQDKTGGRQPLAILESRGRLSVFQTLSGIHACQLRWREELLPSVPWSVDVEAVKASSRVKTAPFAYSLPPPSAAIFLQDDSRSAHRPGHRGPDKLRYKSGRSPRAKTSVASEQNLHLGPGPLEQ